VYAVQLLIQQLDQGPTQVREPFRALFTLSDARKTLLHAAAHNQLLDKDKSVQFDVSSWRFRSFEKIGALGVDSPGSPLKLYFAKMQTFALAPANPAGQKSTSSPPTGGRPHTSRTVLKLLRVDYVFVDEHNRHKRLKGTCPRPFLKADPC
jgi:hypothetical protein